MTEESIGETTTTPLKRSPIPAQVNKEQRLEELTAQISGKTPEQIARTILARERLVERQTRLRGIDQLMELYAPALFGRTLEREVGLVVREHTSPGLGLVLLDLDDFGNFNKLNGKKAGDEVLKTTGKTINNAVRETDLAFREGGEELAIIAPYTNEGPKPDTVGDPAIEETDPGGRVRIAIEKATSPRGFRVKVSAGETDYVRGERPEQLYQRADRARRIAKQLGKNRTVRITQINGMLFAHDLTDKKRYSVNVYSERDENGKDVERFALSQL